MGFFFTLIYIFTAYIGAPILFGDLVQYHLEIIIALLAVTCSVPALQDSDLLDKPQTYGVITLCGAVAFSMVFSGWAGGAPTALFDFLPGAIVFFFIAVNCRKKSHLQILIAILLVTALFTIYRGFEATRVLDSVSPYVITMTNNEKEVFYRIRGVTFLNDPNDFAQFMVGLIPCVFFFWVKGKKIRNLLIVYVPVCLLLFGMYLTHSRGGMIALMTSAMVAGRRKFGLWKSVTAGVLLFVALQVTGFSGGRSVDAESGADRMDAWATGLQLIRMHPIFGVGYGRFTDYHELTAHNTVVVCAAELGLVGFFCWMIVALPTVRDAYVGSSISPSSESAVDEKLDESRSARGSPNRSAARRVPSMSRSGRSESVESRFPAHVVALAGARPLAASTGTFAAPVVPEAQPVAASRPRFINPLRDTEQLPAAEVQRLSNLLLIALTGFFTAGWFLSRAYEMTLFVHAGMVAVVYRIGRDQGLVPPPLTMGRAAKLSVIACVAFIILVWIILRADHL